MTTASQPRPTINVVTPRGARQAVSDGTGSVLAVKHLLTNSGRLETPPMQDAVWE
jgi:hypothetical protein